MKTIILFVLFVYGLPLWAQRTEKVLYCNDRQNVVVRVHGRILQAVTGSDHYIFSYDKTRPDSIGLLQGTPSKDSNLIIRTGKGKLHNFILRFQDSLPVFHYYINDSQAPKVKTQPPKMKESESLSKKIDSELLKRWCKSYQRISKGWLKRKQVQGIVLRIKGMYYHDRWVFVIYQVINRSNIDFEIGELALAKVQGAPNRNSSFQKLPLPSVFQKDLPKSVIPGGIREWVMVYPKFTLARKESLEFVLSEKHGSREVRCRINSI